MLLTLLWACTSNPFGESDIEPVNRTITGTVRLSSADSPSIARIWFDGFDFTERPDASGRFRFVVPPPAAQSASGGLNGVFRVYSYIANFNLVSRAVVLRDGEPVPGKADLSRRGELVPEILLSEQLKIRTEVTPNAVSHTELRFTAEVFLQTFKDTVDVLFPTTPGKKNAPLLLHNLESDSVWVVESLITRGEVSDSVRVSPTLFTRAFLVELTPATLPAGRYEVVPYLLVLDASVPDGLIRSLGPGVEAPGRAYLQMPFVRRGGEFEVVVGNE